MGALLMEASVTQLLVLQFHALYGNHAQQRLSSLSRRDQETMHSVREYLKKRFLEDHTLDSLARQFATNTSKLMAQFKQAFGTSIFEYLSELRMEHARLLLESEGHLVCEVARTLGYKNPNHFSTAFKKHFGFNPKQIARPSAMLG
jgi:AraC-like DNA-binding protein